MSRAPALRCAHVRFFSALQHTDPDYSAAYVVIHTACGLKGFGFTFTLGKGTQIGEVCGFCANKVLNE